MKNLLTTLRLPLELSEQRWLIVGPEVGKLAEALTDRGAQLSLIAWDELDALRDQRFHVVVCQQLFENVRHPLLALESICALTTDYALLHAPLNPLSDERAWLQWEETGWRANRTALARMARSAGFARVAEVTQAEAYTTLQAFRHWPVPSELLIPSLTIRRVFNPVTGTSVFPRYGRRAFLALWVTGLPSEVKRWEVRVNVGGFGVQPIYVGKTELQGCWQINVPMPPGLALGLAAVEVWHRQARAVPCEIDITER